VRVAALLLVTAALAGCGSHRAQSPEQVARAWSADLNRSDDKAAGALFATDAQVVQNGTILQLGRNDAARWNAMLPCGGAILSVVQQAPSEVLVVFRLEDRPGHTCDGPGDTAAAVFRVVGGKITLWHQVPPPSAAQTV
jgi:limonene-1,2-epoxide hydrolase